MIVRVYILLVFLSILSCSDCDSNIAYITKQISATSDDTITIELGEEKMIELCDFESKPKSIMLRGLHTKALNYQSEHGCLKVFVDSLSTTIAGIYSLDITTEAGIHTVSQVWVKAGKAVREIPSFIGPKTVSFKDKRGAMVTAFPVDRYNNPTHQSESLVFTSISDLDKKTANVKTQDTYAVYDIDTKRQEKILIGASSQYAHTKEHQIRILTGCPENIQIKTAELFPIADGRQFFRIETNIMKDEWGRIIENGTFVSFIILDQDSRLYAKYQGMSVSGIASVWIKNPTQAGRYYIFASVCGVQSETKQISLDALIDEVNYAWNNEQIVVGPITSALGQLVADGTLVSLSIFENNTKQEISKELRDGFVRFELDELWIDQELEEANIEIYGIQFPISKYDK